MSTSNTAPTTLQWQGFFDYANTLDEVSVAALQRDCYREMTTQANGQGKRLGPAVVEVEAPLVMEYPEVDPDSEDLPEPVGRKPEDGETPTHTRRVLLAPILSPAPTPDEEMHRVASAQLDTIEESQRVDRSAWTRAQWSDEARTIMGSPGGTVRALLDNHVLSLLSSLTDAESNLPTVDDPADSPLTIDTAFIERLTDALTIARPIALQHHGYNADATRCRCGWPDRDTTPEAMQRHVDTHMAAGMARWLVEQGILPAPPTVASLTLPPTLRVGHCDLCGQTMISDGDVAFHPYNALRPCPEPPRGPDGQYVAGNSPEYLAWRNEGDHHASGRPGSEHFVHDFDTLYPDAPA